MTQLVPFHPGLAAVPLWVMQHLPVMVFVFCLGACVGSFVNVVIYRLPAGMSVISPPSRCPTCAARLKFFRENLPIIGWFAIRGRCRYCGVRVSPQYMLIEALMASIFLGLYAVLFMADASTPWWGGVGGAWWRFNGIFMAWPAYIAIAFMLASLVAMTIIDARTMTIPMEIPLFVTIVAFVAYPLQALLPHRSWGDATWPIPGVDWRWFCTSVGGMLGIVVGLVGLRIGWFHPSFLDYEEHVGPDKPDGTYPHARREMLVELAFLLPCLAGLVGGFVLGGQLPETAPPTLVQAIGGSFAGYLTGGAFIWGIRILGTLVFGREAMGLGDVHLLGAIGAALGWFDPILIFFVAPFSGILWFLVSMGLSAVLKKRWLELPFGPHLAVATLVVFLGRPGFQAFHRIAMPGVPWPRAGLVQSPPDPAARAGTPPPEDTGGDPAADNLPLPTGGAEPRIG